MVGGREQPGKGARELEIGLTTTNTKKSESSRQVLLLVCARTSPTICNWNSGGRATKEYHLSVTCKRRKSSEKNVQRALVASNIPHETLLAYSSDSSSDYLYYTRMYMRTYMAMIGRFAGKSGRTGPSSHFVISGLVLVVQQHAEVAAIPV